MRLQVTANGLCTALGRGNAHYQTWTAPYCEQTPNYRCGQPVSECRSSLLIICVSWSVKTHKRLEPLMLQVPHESGGFHEGPVPYAVPLGACLRFGERAGFDIIVLQSTVRY